MKILGLSGSARKASTNTALLRNLAGVSPHRAHVTIYDQIGKLPIFSPDIEGDKTPKVVCDFAAMVGDCDGMIVSCPEYVRALPGGFKNAIDWLVSRDEIINKPIALLHASTRGMDVRADLDLVLATVSAGFRPDISEEFHLIGMTEHEVGAFCARPDIQPRMSAFWERFISAIAAPIAAPRDAGANS